MRSLSPSLTLVTTKHGHLHLRVSEAGLQLASEVRGLKVHPTDPAAWTEPTSVTYGPRHVGEHVMGLWHGDFSRGLQCWAT